MKTLRCMAYQQSGVFVAACLDLSLAAQADTLKEAMEKLDIQIKDLIEEACREPQYAGQILNRKAPASMWLKYWLIAFRIYFNKQQEATLFVEPCKAIA